MTKTYMMHFYLLVFFYLENVNLFYFHMILFLSLWIYHYHHKQVHSQILYQSVKLLTFPIF